MAFVEKTRTLVWRLLKSYKDQQRDMGCGASTSASHAGLEAAKGPRRPVPAAVPAPQSVPAPDPMRSEPVCWSSAGSSAPASCVLPARIRTEELVKLCQSSHFDRTQVSMGPSPDTHHWPAVALHMACTITGGEAVRALQGDQLER